MSVKAYEKLKGGFIIMNSTQQKKLDFASIEVYWNRLISAVDEASISLIRTAFSPVVREFHDFACGLFNQEGDLLAQSSYSTPGLLGVLPLMIKNFLKIYPCESLNPGDVLITNDPWLASGHLIDITVTMPIFYKEKLVGFCLTIVHHIDMGGRMSTTESKETFEEGLHIPLCKLHDKGSPNQLVYDFIANNVRMSNRVIGDVKAQISANYVMSSRVKELLKEADLSDLNELGKEIIARTEKATRDKIGEVPNGIYRYEKFVERVSGGTVRLVVSVEVKDDEIVIDYAGTSPQIDEAINSTLSMTTSYSMYPIKCAIYPLILNNEGSLRTVTVKVPEGSVLNAKWPAATWGRTVIVQHLPELVFLALTHLIPDKIVAGCGGAPICYGNLAGTSKNGERFLTPITNQGGFGASHFKDGHCTLSFPGNVANIPIEVSESEAPIIYLKKELISDSGGPGKFRGGCGQISIIKPIHSEERGVEGSMVYGVRGGRFEDSIPGICGGKDSGVTKVIINDKRERPGKQIVINPRDTLILEAPGGGGYGDALTRDPELVRDDVRNGYVSIKKAISDYGVIIDEKSMDIDIEGTKTLRAQLKKKKVESHK